MKLNNKGNTKIIVALLVIALVGMGVWYMQYQNGLVEDEAMVADEEVMVEDEKAMMEDDAMMDDKMMMEDGTMVKDETAMEMTAESSAMVMEKARTSEVALMGELEDVAGGDSTGTACVVREDGTLCHRVTATMPEPAEGSVYEGWLVQQTPELMFFSTGVMEQNDDGTYTLNYMGESVYEGYDFVVITEETVVDEIPEVHVLEGSVQ